MMTISTKAAFDRIEIYADGSIRCFFNKQILNGDAVIADTGSHLITISPGEDANANLASASANLDEMGFGQISAEDAAKVAGAVSTFQTADVVTEFKSVQAASSAMLIDPAQSADVAALQAKIR